MPIPDPYPDPAPVERRERGLRRVGSATRWTATAALAGTVVLGIGYAQALPGGTDTPGGSSRHARRADRPQPPAAAPVVTSQPAQTVTGAS